MPPQTATAGPHRAAGHGSGVSGKAPGSPPCTPWAGTGSGSFSTQQFIKFKYKDYLASVFITQKTVFSRAKIKI